MPPLRGLHVNDANDPALWRVLDSAGRGRVGLVKVVNPNQGQLRRLRDDYGVALTVGRFVLDGEGLDPTPAVAAERWYRALRDRLMPLVPYLDYLEVPINEAFERAPDLARYAAASARFVELASDDGLRVLVGGFARGTPEIEDFPQFLPAIRAAWRYDGGFHCHEYFHRGRLDLTWQVGRIKRFYDVVPPKQRVPVIISEYGLDNGDLPRYQRKNAGWRDAGYGAAGDYAADLDAGHAYYEIACPEVVGTCLFNLGDFDGTWASFSADDPVLTAWVAGGPRRAEPAPPPPPPPDPREKPMPKLFADQFPASLAPALRELTPWPTAWTQLDDWSLDTDGDQARENNCGAQSVAAALYHLTGVEQSCDVIRETVVRFFGAPKNGYLTTDHLVSYLRRFCGVECQVASGDGSTRLRPLVEQAVTDGTPLIVLFAWDYERFDATGHFCPVVGYNADGVFVHEVYRGGRKALTWTQFEDWQKYGQAIRLLRRRWDALPRY